LDVNKILSEGSTKMDETLFYEWIPKLYFEETPAERQKEISLEIFRE